MKIKAIVFDVDGTIYPNNMMYFWSIPLFLRYGRRLLRFNKARDYLHKHPDEAGSLGLTFLEYQGQLMSEYSHGRYDSATSSRQIEEFRYHWERIFRFIKPYKNFKESMVALKEEGFKLALFSDFPIHPKIDYLGLPNLWDAVLCSEDVGALKPDPRGFLAIAKMLNVEPFEILFVGNSHKYDVQGAREAGMYTAHLQWGKAKKGSLADITFYGYKSFKDLVLNWIASL